MSTYTAPHRATSKRSLPRRARIVVLASLLVPVSLLAISRSTVHADPSSNPVFATIDYVQNAINTALAPIQSAIASLQSRQSSQSSQLRSQQSAISNLQSTQATHTSQINDLQAQQANQAQQITNLLNTTGKSLKAYDANGQELGLVVGHGGNQTQVFIPSLNKFITLADSTYAEQNANTSLLSSGIAVGLEEIDYLSSDCTGTPYGQNYSYSSNTIMAFNATENYTYDLSDPVTTSRASSWRDWNEAPTACHSGLTPSSLSLLPLHLVNLPFTTPIAEPIQFKYQ